MVMYTGDQMAARIERVRLTDGFDGRVTPWRTLSGPMNWAFLSTLPQPDTRPLAVESEPLTRRCSRCHVVKALDEFHVDAKSPLGRRYDCRTCNCRQRHQQWLQREAS